MVILTGLNRWQAPCHSQFVNLEKKMDALQKIIIFITVFLVVSGLIWFIFLAH